MISAKLWVLFFILGCAFCDAIESKRLLGRKDIPSLEQQGIYHHRMYSNETHHHAKSWQALAEVDGLKNEDVVALVTSSSVQDFVFVRSR